MASQEKMAATQLANLLALTGKSVAAHAAEISKTDLSKHMEIVKYLKANYGLGHGNSSLLAAKIREQLEGAPVSDKDLLKAQYAGAKSGLEPLMVELAAYCAGMGGDVSKVVQKTGLAFRRNKLFALIQAPSAKRIQLSLNLPETPNDERVQAYKGMCKHKVDLGSLEDLDDQVVGWIRESYGDC